MIVLKLGEPHHFAYLVEDIGTTAERLAEQLGAGPFFLIEKVPLEDLRSGEEPAEFVHDSAFGACGEVAIELIRTERLSPEPVERGFSGPRPRLHHVGYVAPADEVSELRDELDDRGMPRYLSARLEETENSFHDASALLGHDLEIHLDCKGLRDFFGMVKAAAEGWDGSDPLRPLPEA